MGGSLPQASRRRPKLHPGILPLRFQVDCERSASTMETKIDEGLRAEYPGGGTGGVWPPSDTTPSREASQPSRLGRTGGEGQRAGAVARFAVMGYSNRDGALAHMRRRSRSASEIWGQYPGPARLGQLPRAALFGGSTPGGAIWGQYPRRSYLGAVPRAELFGAVPRAELFGAVPRAELFGGSTPSGAIWGQYPERSYLGAAPPAELFGGSTPGGAIWGQYPERSYLGQYPERSYLGQYPERSYLGAVPRAELFGGSTPGGAIWGSTPSGAIWGQYPERSYLGAEPRAGTEGRNPSRQGPHGEVCGSGSVGVMIRLSRLGSDRGRHAARSIPHASRAGCLTSSPADRPRAPRPTSRALNHACPVYAHTEGASTLTMQAQPPGASAPLKGSPGTRASPSAEPAGHRRGRGRVRPHRSAGGQRGSADRLAGAEAFSAGQLPFGAQGPGANPTP
ncbi:hypothetical protein PLESTM_000098400 [Pleodorina starrii]|nr:hypothetical protein PLESTM_000098400 [Pleodorina starrii]